MTVKLLKHLDGNFTTGDIAERMTGNMRVKYFQQEKSFITIRTKNIPFNYSEFWIVLNSDKQKQVKGGRFVECSVLNKTGEVLIENMRMVFPKNSQAEKAVKGLSKGATL